MNIRIRELGNVNIIDIEGNVDINSSELIETVGWLLKNGKKDILLNLDKVDMVDYSGVSILAIAYKNIANHGGRLKFCNVSLHIEELLKLVRLESVFEVYSSEEDAVKSFFFDSPIDKKFLRRRFKRLDINIDVEFCLAGKAGDQREIWHSGKLLNISGDGLFLFTKKLLPLGKGIRVKIDINNKHPLEIEGTVIWLADKALQPQSYPGMGIYFQNIPKRVQDRMLEFINKHLTHRSASS